MSDQKNYTHGYPRKLIAVEGKSGDGIHTFSEFLRNLIYVEGFPCIISRWDSSKLFSDLIEIRGIEKSPPKVIAMLHASDLARRIEKEINPALEAGFFIIADQYLYTPMAIALASGVEPNWLSNLYSFALEPDISFCIRSNGVSNGANGHSKKGKIGFYEFCLNFLLTKSYRGDLKAFEESVEKYFESLLDKGKEFKSIFQNEDKNFSILKDPILDALLRSV